MNAINFIWSRLCWDSLSDQDDRVATNVSPINCNGPRLEGRDTTSMTRFQNTQLQNFQIIIEQCHLFDAELKKSTFLHKCEPMRVNISLHSNTAQQHDRAELSDSMIPGDVGDNRAAIESIQLRDHLSSFIFL